MWSKCKDIILKVQEEHKQNEKNSRTNLDDNGNIAHDR